MIRPTALIDRARLASLHAEEEQRFVDLHPTSARLAAEAGTHLLATIKIVVEIRYVH